MSNYQSSIPELYSRLLLFRHALAAEFKVRKQHLPAMPVALPHLLQALEDEKPGVLGSPGVREALLQTRACLFEVQGRDVEALAAWQESVACALFAASVARMKSAPIATAACGGLLHRAGEMLALKILARVELEYRSKLEGPARREWCSTHCHELQERLLRAWPLPAEVGACLLGWNRFGELTEASAEGAAVYFGRLLAIRLLQPEICVPGILEQAAEALGLSVDAVARLELESAAVRDLIRAVS